MNPSIPWSRPDVGDSDLKAIMEAFTDDWLTMGPRTDRFEQAMARRMSRCHAVAVSSGSVALDIALRTLGVGPGDEVIVPAITYFATAAAVSRVGAVPVFVDVQPQNLNLDADVIVDALSPRTRGIVYIDYGGLPADFDRLDALARAHGLFLLHDAAHSLGGLYHGHPLGSQTPLSTMSFHMAKVMTCVEGGMIFTDDDQLAHTLRLYRNQGESDKYIHSKLGYNARMTDISAAIGLNQLNHLDRYLDGRRRVCRAYDRHFDQLGIDTLSNPHPDTRAAPFLYSVLLDERDQVAAGLKERGIDTRVCYPMPLYRQPVYLEGEAPSRHQPCPVSERISKRILNLPLFPSMSDDQIDQVVHSIDALNQGPLVSGL
ncbi:DegT/DnrJ/EryC1/StrS family aminotransferase [Ferrimonas sediminicola]|uniref:DegT/DnrJ/EryC1/StrS family aminotransferase n=1 Tax=Ferrimonas sediminicola TaxID=2569538 RepID=A0A4U1B827_9GAMM|nr:DegT/DnrJ/EryC1/StrS family aminotransferase [Ferrimonas sediminicola]TKB46805.1 DegT/DnrJ/EryC1/StrS family aminotransferase [Ferrimonas sediminicola]